MASSNEITGSRLVTKPNTIEYENNYDKIFGNKEKKSCSCFHWVGGCCGSSGTDETIIEDNND